VRRGRVTTEIGHLYHYRYPSNRGYSRPCSRKTQGGRRLTTSDPRPLLRGNSVWNDRFVTDHPQDLAVLRGRWLILRSTNIWQTGTSPEGPVTDTEYTILSLSLENNDVHCLTLQVASLERLSDFWLPCGSQNTYFSISFPGKSLT